MEYALWHHLQRRIYLYSLCLNPCSNGICSLAKTKLSGTPTATVLILVLMEYALWLDGRKTRRTAPELVLILVLMEYALWPP